MPCKLHYLYIDTTLCELPLRYFNYTSRTYLRAPLRNSYYGTAKALLIAPRQLQTVTLHGESVGMEGFEAFGWENRGSTSVECDGR